MRSLPRILSLLFGATLGVSALAQDSDAVIKAAFVYNFTKFVVWPSEDTGPLQLCVVGEPDPLLLAVAGLEGKQSQGRSIRVRNAEPQAAALKACHLILIGTTEARRVEAILKEAQGSAALTVSEIENFADAGGMIGLVLGDARVRFEINAEAAQRANLKLSAQLLKLARSVKK
jgi:YfiR/HmsC-like